MEIKNYKKGDEFKILELFEICFKKEMNLDYWKWRFENNPFTDDMFIKLMWDDNLLIGHYAVSPIEMMVDNEIYLAGLSMTTMTHPEYGGKGIFSKLAESVYEHQKQKDHLMVWGFPNNNSHYGFNKNLNWRDIALLGMMSLSVSEFKNANNFDNWTPINSFDKLTASIFNTKTTTVSINKTIEYLNWRYFKNPTAKYNVIIDDNNLVGLIYKIIPSFTNPDLFEIDILECNFNNNIDTLRSLISYILSIETGVVKLNLWDSIFSANQIALEKIGFRIGAPVTYLGARLFQNNKSVEDYKNWDISFGYSDIF